METIYLKTVLPFTGEKKIKRVIALTKSHTIYVSDDNISFDEASNDDGTWFKKEWKAVESTKAEFDAFYVKTVNELNNLIKEL
jgi:hypothetical protein